MKNLTPVEEGIIRGLIATDEQIGPALKRVMEYGAELEAEIERLRAALKTSIAMAADRRERAQQAEARLAQVVEAITRERDNYDDTATEQELLDIILTAAQPEEQLSPEAAKVLRENAWDLYDSAAQPEEKP